WQETLDDFADPSQIATAAILADGDWRLTGSKRFVTAAWAAASYIVSARTPEGFGLFWVDGSTSGLTLTQEWRADGSPAGRLDLDDVRVGPDAFLAGPGKAEGMLRDSLDEMALVAAA